MKKQTKSFTVLKDLAEELLYLEEGSQIPTISELVKRYKVGTGTVQNALELLKNGNAAVLENSGSRGNVLVKKNVQNLLDIIGHVNYLGVMPLPYSKRYEGLATGLYELLNQTVIRVNLAFMSGSDLRLSGVLEGKYDFMVTSKKTAGSYIEKFKEIEVYGYLHEESFIKNHVFLTTKNLNEEYKKSEERLRIGIDLNSPDQSSLTMRYCEGKNVQLIPIKYTDTLRALRKGIIDGAIWSGEEEYEELNVFQINGEGGRDETIAAVIGMKENTRFKRYFTHFIDTKKLKEIQDKVMDGSKMPNY